MPKINSTAIKQFTADLVHQIQHTHTINHIRMLQSWYGLPLTPHPPQKPCRTPLAPSAAATKTPAYPASTPETTPLTPINARF